VKLIVLIKAVQTVLRIQVPVKSVWRAILLIIILVFKTVQFPTAVNVSRIKIFVSNAHLNLN